MSSSKLTNIGSELRCDIQGHGDFLAGIDTSLSNGRMHHAWLITGPVGIGKASMAKLAAARLLSEKAHSGVLFEMERPDFKIDAEDAGARYL